MKKPRVTSEKNTGIIVHIVFGVLLAIGCAFILSILAATMVEKEIVSINSVSKITLLIHAISVFAGSLLSISLEKGRIAVVAAITTLSYLFVIVCMNMLFFSSGFQGVGGGIISCLIGGMLSIVIKGKHKGKSKHRMKIRSR